MHTVLLLSESIPLCKEKVEIKIDEEITHNPVDEIAVDRLLEDYFNLMKISVSASYGRMMTSQRTSIQVLMPDLEKLERAVRKRRNIFEKGSDEEMFECLKKYEDIFTKHSRDFQDFHYRIPEPFSAYSDEKIKRMLWIKLSNSYEYPAKNDIYKAKFYFAWHPEVEEFKLLNKIPGLRALSATPFETYALSVNGLSNGFLMLEVDSNDFFTLETHRVNLHNGILTIRKKTLFASRRIDPATEFLSKDIKFVKPLLRQALKRMDLVFQVHSLLYEGLRCA